MTGQLTRANHAPHDLTITIRGINQLDVDVVTYDRDRLWIETPLVHDLSTLVKYYQTQE
jgi:hypothetical protein